MERVLGAQIITKAFRRNLIPLERMIIILGTVMRLIKEMTVTRGNVMRVVVMKDKKMISRTMKKEQTVM
jgi:hypothetical protein